MVPSHSYRSTRVMPVSCPGASRTPDSMPSLCGIQYATTMSAMSHLRVHDGVEAAGDVGDVVAGLSVSPVLFTGPLHFGRHLMSNVSCELCKLAVCVDRVIDVDHGLGFSSSPLFGLKPKSSAPMR